jgi:hypothetical protein
MPSEVDELTDAPTTDALLAELQQTRAEIQRAADAMLDSQDTPGSWTRRREQTYEECRRQLPSHVAACNTLTEHLSKAIATRDRLVPSRDRLRAAQTAIEERRRTAPDDAVTQRSLASALQAIERGVSYAPYTGKPLLPEPLRVLLADTCPSCGHVELLWIGPLPGLEAEIAEADKMIASGPAALASIRAGVTPWLAEAVRTG